MSETPEHILIKIREAKDKQLKELDLSRSWLSQIPAEVFELKDLNLLNLRNNKLTSIPESITSLQNLTKLDLGNNQLSSFPEDISRLQSLNRLDLSENQLTILPDFITRLKNLTLLVLSFNKLSSIPESIVLLKNLTRLYLNDNELTTIPASITQLEKLEKLYLSSNPITNPPLEIAIKGIEAIRDYFRQFDRGGKYRYEKEEQNYIYEAKLLIIGEAGAGKTTLARKIENPDYELRTDEKSTEGIDVIHWNFDMENGQPFRVNIWDFGGQEIYHATHQFFLTKRSLYALVADTRKEDTDFYYWLNIVGLLSDNSPLLIIKNEKQDRQREIPENQLRGQFANFKETLPANLATNRGLIEILLKVRHFISTLPHVGSVLPKTWVRVRKSLENDSRNHISLDEYLSICEHNGFKLRKDKLQLSEYLHDLGVCLHFQDDPLLKKTVILNPRWGTDAVYQVLDNKAVILNLGRFTKADLSDIWHENIYAGMQDELLQLMLNFQLCYKIPNSRDTYIAPQLLTENQPEYEWNETDNLLLRYTYDLKIAIPMK